MVQATRAQTIPRVSTRLLAVIQSRLALGLPRLCGIPAWCLSYCDRVATLLLCAVREWLVKAQLALLLSGNFITMSSRLSSGFHLLMPVELFLWHARVRLLSKSYRALSLSHTTRPPQSAGQ